MKQIFLFFFLLLFPGIIQAGDKNFHGTPEKKLLRATETERIKIINELADFFLETAPEKSIRYGKEALSLAEKKDDKKEKAAALRNIGIAYRNMSNYDKALEYLLTALNIRKELGDRQSIADSLHHLGIVYDYLNNYDKSLEYHEKALKIQEEAGYRKGIADSFHNIGIIHHLSKQHNDALQYYRRGLEIRQDIQDTQGVAASLNNIGVLYMDVLNYQESMDYFLDALQIFDQMGQKYEVANIENNLGKLGIETQKYDVALEHLERGLKIAQEIGAKELIRENYSYFSDLYIAQEDFQKALDYYKLSADMKNRIFTAESQSRIAEIQTKYETENKQKEIEILKKNNEISRLEVDRQKLLRNSFLVGFTFVLLLAMVLYNRYLFKKKAHSELENAHRLIMEEKAKSDRLLLNILPMRVANELKEKGKAEPESFENVTVYFSDIVGFTKLSSDLDPKMLIQKLNEIFTEFDNIIEKYYCERVKTIGDAYLCVCGMPEKDPRHAENIISAAIEIIRYMRKINADSEMQWEIRIGIHSGRVVGGVVGIKKYIYDVFGDTINTASRMESNSEPMKINVSESTYYILKNRYPFVEREAVHVKGKGMMRMYFLDESALDDSEAGTV